LVGLRRCHTEILQLPPAVLFLAAALLTLSPLRPAQGLRQQRLPLMLQALKPLLLLHHRRCCLNKHGRQVLPHCTPTNNLKQQCWQADKRAGKRSTGGRRPARHPASQPAHSQPHF
jgi:hypothetical protein